MKYKNKNFCITYPESICQRSRVQSSRWTCTGSAGILGNQISALCTEASDELSNDTVCILAAAFCLQTGAASARSIAFAPDQNSVLKTLIRNCKRNRTLIGHLRSVRLEWVAALTCRLSSMAGATEAKRPFGASRCNALHGVCSE